jgi:hypothetical protein
MLSIDTMAATSSCRRTGVPEGGCSGLKLGRAEGAPHRCNAPGSADIVQDIARRAKDVYRSQKTVKVDGHLGNVGS